MTDIHLRAATLADAPAIARLHLASWRRAYRDLAPREAFEAMDEALRVKRWTAMLASPLAQQAVVVAQEGGRLAGVGMAASPSQPGFGGRGEIRSLYLDPAFQRAGLGRSLMSALAEQIAAWGYPGAALGVVVGNEPAIAFYNALGGRVVGKYVDPGPLWRSENLIFVWDEIFDLIGGAWR
ncbi:MAG: GNAT family N-acetyltransferase [Pseudomonadota bacterium]